MSKITFRVFTCCLLFICLGNSAPAQHSSVVTGESLAKVKNSITDKLKSPSRFDLDRQRNMHIVESSGAKAQAQESSECSTYTF